MCNIEEATNSDKLGPEHRQQITCSMDSPAADPGPAPSSNEEPARVKFLCSFSGSILPRPQDGKLRYVGGETRIVSLPRDITYEELVSKMRELYEGTNVLKYQQPDEDLDALVSVVNDDDVINMMEEYDKVGSGDGLTRLRIFLFSNPEQDFSSLHFVNGDKWDNERRYVDALNSVNECQDFFRRQQSESLVGSFDEDHGAHMSLEGSFHGQRNMELPMAQMNLRQLTIPRPGSGQLLQQQQPVSQRCNDMEAPWSPAYYSPRPVPEFLPISPSSSQYRVAVGDFSEDYSRIPVNVQDNFLVVSEKSGFPGNIMQGSNVYEGTNSICEFCRVGFHKNQVFSEHLHAEQPNMGSGGFIPGSNSCVGSPANREMYVDANIHPPLYCRDHYHEMHGHERGWASPHQHSPWTEELRPPVSASYIVENGVTHGNVGGDSHHLQPHYVIQDQSMAAMEERVVRYVNSPYTYGTDGACHVAHAHLSSQALWRNLHGPVPVAPSYEPSGSSQAVNGSTSKGFVRESSPQLKTGLAYQNPWIDASQRVAGFDGSPTPNYLHDQVLKLGPTYVMETQQPNVTSGVSTNLAAFNEFCPVSEVVVPIVGDALNAECAAIEGAESAMMNGKMFNETKETNAVEAEDSTLGCALNVGATSSRAPEEAPADRLDFLPELIESVKEAALKSLKEVKAKVQVETEINCENDLIAKVDTENHREGNIDVEPDNDNANHSKIELTKAEAEAIDRGLQTIKYEDLEEIRELGSGTYGAVYHGKWKGSDVAIKKIKASCFAARPSERERLIADFWKEALLLSSLHHPNVVSFYGVARDGPDGSLATVTEYMVNGSLKQYLQKKNSTIDRRKRLIIAMDVAIGMEHLHDKKIVHFDLKCENLLVNMRDPHRPVCKIGDMGMSKVRHKTLVSGGVRGTLPWMAPELLNGKCNMVSEKIDVYSFAIVMWELLTGDEPYAGMHGGSIIGGIVSNTLRPQTPVWCDPEWKSLMESCWADDPTQRPSFSEISHKLRNMAAPMNLK